MATQVQPGPIMSTKTTLIVVTVALFAIAICGYISSLFVARAVNSAYQKTPPTDMVNSVKIISDDFSNISSDISVNEEADALNKSVDGF